MNSRIIFALLASIYAFSAVAAQPSAPAGAPEFLKGKGLHVLSKKPGPNGTTAWVVSAGKGSKPAVMYVTQDGKTAFAGVVWDAKTGQVLSNNMITDADKQASEALPPASGAQSSANQPAAQQLPPLSAQKAVEQINSKRGFLDGKPRPIDQILYVVFDPKCPYCHKLYQALRPAVAAGQITVKWLPVIVLGNDQQRLKSLDSIVTGLAMKDQTKAIQQVFENASLAGGKPDERIVADLMTNEQFLRATYTSNPDLGQIGVPTAYYLNAAGQPVVRKAGDTAIVQHILQDIKKK